jgi:predicted Zn-dependent peptidase
MIKKIYFRNGKEGIPLYYFKKKESLYLTIQVWIHVGSVDELIHEQGMAHMIEHLFFKKTKTIGRGELDFLIHQMSGTSNAYTSKDFTVYLFSVPKVYFEELVSILSSLFEYQEFTNQDLQIEKEIVFQEINLYEDDPFSCLIDEAFLEMKMNFNYAHKILGTKETIKSFSFNGIRNFFKKYYQPSRMMLFVSGDLTFFKIKKALAGSYFSQPIFIESDEKKYIVAEKKEKNIKHNRKIIFGNTENNHFLLCFHFPVCEYEDFFIFKALNLLLGGGKDSLLYKIICTKLKLVTDIKSFFHGMMKETFFFIYFNPVSVEFENLIIVNIKKIFETIQCGTYGLEQLERILNILEFEYQAMFSDDTDEYIGIIAPYAFIKHYNFLKKFVFCKNKIKKKIAKLSVYFQTEYFDTIGYLNQKEKKLIFAKGLCEENAIISKPNQKEKNFRPIAAPKNEIKGIHLPRKKKLFISECDIVYDATDITDQIKALFPKKQYNFEDDIVVLYFDSRVRYFHQEKELLGGLAFLFDWMAEGTKGLPGNLFAEFGERYGIEFVSHTGFIEIRCLKKYLNEGLFLLKEYLLFPEFSDETFAFLKLQVIENIKNFLDDPGAVGLQQIRELIYQDHPYGSNPSGTIESVNSFTPDKIKKLYKKYIISDDMFVTIIGDVDQKMIVTKMKEMFFEWKTKNTFVLKNDLLLNQTIPFPEKKEYFLQTKKEQGILLFGGLSAKKYTKDYFALLIADQIFSGGSSGGMHSRLFALREKTGFFYDISGSLILGAGEAEGMFVIKAMTKKEHLDEAEKLIRKVIFDFADSILKEEVIFSKRLLLYSFAQKTETKEYLLQGMINQYRYKLLDIDLKQHYSWIKTLKTKEIKEIIKKYFSGKNLVSLIYKK